MEILFWYVATKEESISFENIRKRDEFHYTARVFRQAFLLSQYSFICVQYFKRSDT